MRLGTSSRCGGLWQLWIVRLGVEGAGWALGAGRVGGREEREGGGREGQRRGQRRGVGVRGTGVEGAGIGVRGRQVGRGGRG